MTTENPDLPDAQVLKALWQFLRKPGVTLVLELDQDHLQFFQSELQDLGMVLITKEDSESETVIRVESKGAKPVVDTKSATPITILPPFVNDDDSPGSSLLPLLKILQETGVAFEIKTTTASGVMIKREPSLNS
jgi:hypothetical protein